MGDVAVCSVWWSLIWFTESLSWNKWEQRKNRFRGKKPKMNYGLWQKKAGELDAKRAQKGKRNKEWKNTLFLLWSKTLTKSRSTNWLGTPPAIMAARRGLQLSSLTLSRCQDKSCFPSEFLYSRRDAGAALTHFPLQYPGARQSNAKCCPDLPAR